MAVSIIGPKFYAWDREGKPLAFGKLYTYQARTNNPKDTYKSEDQVVANENPVILNGEGYADIYLSGSYKMVLKDQDNNEVWTSDPVSSAEPSEWVLCLTSTYVNPTTFKVNGNFVDKYSVGRRVRIDNNSSDYSYSTIKDSVFAAGETTVTVLDPFVTTGVQEVCVSIVTTEAIVSVKDNAIINHKYLDLMIQDTLLKVGNRVKTACYHEDVEGGGGEYLIVSGGTGANDGGSYIGLDNGLQAKLIIEDTLSVKQFGAKGNGVTDDREAIQAAIDYSVSVNTDNVYLVFSPCSSFYAIGSTNGTYTDSGLILNSTGTVEFKGAQYKGVIKATIAMDSLVYVATRINFFRMQDIVFDANNLANHAFYTNDSSPTDYTPYCSYQGITFTKALVSAARISSFVTGLDRCIFSNSPIGLKYFGVSPGPNTSTAFNNCYTLNCSDIGYDMGFMTYCAMVACASDDCTIAYKFTSAYGVSLLSCGAERCAQPINFIGWRGVSVNTFYMLGCGSGTSDTDYLIEFSGGGFGATLAGIYNNNPAGSAKKLGMTSATNGSENITVLDDTIKRTDTYFVTNGYANGQFAVKFLWDEFNRDETYNITADNAELNTVLSSLADKQVNGDVVINLSGSFPDQTTTSLIRATRGRGRTALKFVGDGTAVINNKFDIFGADVIFENIEFRQSGGGFEVGVRCFDFCNVILSNCRFTVIGNGGTAIRASEGSRVLLNDNSSVTGNFSTGASKTFDNDGTCEIKFYDTSVSVGDWFPEGVLIADNSGTLAGVMCITEAAYSVGNVNYKEF